MSFGLWDLLLAGLLLVNAVAVLNEQRFLVHIGFSTNSLNEPGFGQQQQQQQASVKSRLITLISSVQMLLRIPLIFLNIFVIGFELVLG